MRSLMWAFLLIISLQVNAQDWQTLYQSSRAAFQGKNYKEAIVQAEKALAVCPSDVKSKAFTLQLITASCLESEMAAKGLAFADQEIEAFNTLEPNGKNYQESLRKKGNLLVLAGKPSDAALTFRLLSVAKKNAGDSNSLSYWQAVTSEADALLQAKEYATAVDLYAKSVPAFKALPDAGEDYLYGLFNLSFTTYQLKNFSAASATLKEFISLAESNDLKAMPEYDQAQKMLSSINSNGSADSKGGFLVAEDKIKVLMNSAVIKQGKDVNEALREYSECEQLIANNKIINNTSFSCYLNHARFLFSLGRLNEATERAMLADQQAKQLFTESQVERGYVLLLQGDLMVKQKKFIEAKNVYGSALTIFLTQPADLLLKQLRWISNQLIQENAASEAVPLIQLVVSASSFQKLPDAHKIDVFRVATDVFIDARQFKPLQNVIAKNLATGSTPLLKQASLLFSAQASREEGNFGEAMASLKQASVLGNAGGLDGEILFETARLHQQLGEYREAELTYQEATRVATKSGSAAFSRQIANSFATFYIQLGNYKEAEKLFLRLLSGTDSEVLFQNTVRQNLAAMYQQTGRYAEARRLLIKVVQTDRQMLGDVHPDYAISLQNLASVYLKIGKLDSALQLYEQALAIDKKASGEKSVSYATKLANLGAVYQELGNFSKAQVLYSQALLIRKDVLHSEHPDYAYNLYNLGYLLYRTNQPEKAYPYFKESADFFLRQVKDVFPVLSDYERTAFYNRIQPVISSYEAFMIEYSTANPKAIGELLNFRLETKALLLGAALKVRNQVLSSGNKELISKFAVWQHTKEQLAYLYSLNGVERSNNKVLIDEYKAKANELEKWLSFQSTAFGHVLASSAVDWKKVQSALSADQVALEIVRSKLPGDSVVYAAIVLQPAPALPAMIVLPDGDRMEERFFRGYSNLIRFQQEDRMSYNVFWKKIHTALGSARLVYFSPDGVYNKVNPLTFLNPEGNKYVADDLQILNCSNLKEIAVTNVRAQTESSALLVGFPDYQLGASLRFDDIPATTRGTNVFSDVLKNGIADLPGTGAEVAMINQSLGNGQWKTSVFTRQSASEDVIKKASNPALLHIATHGFFIAPEKEDGTQVYSQDLSQAENSVMLRSGLLLAGAEKNLLSRLNGQSSQGNDDGVLTAFEVMNLNLDQTSLVVLSACETGSGDVRNGEGVYGLQRAFMLAGAKSVIMSLWKVDDEATQFLMTEFYKKWTTGIDRSQAFYNTLKDVRKKYPHPYYWGAFVVTGNL